MKTIHLILIIFVIILEGCFTPTQSPIFPVVVSPGHIRLKATILYIDSLAYNFDSEDPCSNAPCVAEVRIDSVEGFGMGAKPVLSGDKIKVKFVLTMKPVIHPEDSLQSLPGLTINDIFRAEVQSKKDDKIFIVNKYIVLKK